MTWQEIQGQLIVGLILCEDGDDLLSSGVSVVNYKKARQKWRGLYRKIKSFLSAPATGRHP